MNNSVFTDHQEDVLLDEDTDISKKLVVYNDDINSFQHVIYCLMQYCEQEVEQAEQCALMIHTKGKYAVKHGDMQKLKPIKEALQDQHLTVKIEE